MRFRKRRYKYVNGTKGVISIFLALLMTPFLTIAGSLINSARINSAVAIFDEALCNSSESTLGTYDEFLRKRFGLLAMSQALADENAVVTQYNVSDLISETFAEYLKENVGVLSNTYVTYESKSQGVYPLANTNILMSQILEYSKYSVPAKIVGEGFSLEDIIDTLEEYIPGAGIFDLITAGAGMADSFVALGTEMEVLKDAISEEETAYTNYNNDYNTFATSVSNYIAKEAEKQTALAAIQLEIDAAQKMVDEKDEKIPALNSEIASLQAVNPEDPQIAVLEAEVAEYENAEATLAAAEASYLQTEADYNTQLNTLAGEVDTAKLDYSSSISELSGKLLSVKGKVTKVKDAILGIGSAAAETVVAASSVPTDDEIEKKEKNIEELDKKIEKATGSQKIELENQKTQAEDAIVGLKNKEAVVKATEEGVNEAFASLDDFKNFNEGIYETASNELLELKEEVDKYDTENISAEIDKAKYYVELFTGAYSGMLTLEGVAELEKNLVNEIKSASVWALLEALLGFFESLFSLTVFYHAECGAVINKSGLPSQKDRTVEPLNNGVAGDKDLSDYYKSIYGDYGDPNGAVESEFDVIQAIIDIFVAMGVISSNVTLILTSTIEAIFKFAEIYKAITTAVDTIVTKFKAIVTHLGQILTSIQNKILLTGYVNYMTSDRTTYASGRALTGNSFNLRQTQTTTHANILVISDIASFISSINSAAAGGTETCFVGAEKEYIMFGESSEIVNQQKAFLVVYLIRAVINIIPIFTNAEVTAIAAASTIGAPIVYIALILLEPLVDTIIMVNSGSTPLIKGKLYLTPSGIEGLISQVSSLKLNSTKLNKVKEKLVGIETSGGSYTEVKNKLKADGSKGGKNFLNVSYSQMLMIVMTLATPSDQMLDRLSDIIQMEARAYQENVEKKPATFNLDHSYTYIRTEASFTTNEFLPVSNGVGLSPSKRVIYRGY